MCQATWAEPLYYMERFIRCMVNHGNRAEPSGSSQSRHGRYYGLACARDLAFSESRALQSDARRADLRGGATSAARAFSAAAEAQADGQK
jgi:hypothetical protein